MSVTAKSTVTESRVKSRKHKKTKKRKKKEKKKQSTVVTCEFMFSALRARSSFFFPFHFSSGLSFDSRESNSSLVILIVNPHFPFPPPTINTTEISRMRQLRYGIAQRRIPYRRADASSRAFFKLRPTSTDQLVSTTGLSVFHLFFNSRETCKGPLFPTILMDRKYFAAFFLLARTCCRESPRTHLFKKKTKAGASLV